MFFSFFFFHSVQSLAPKHEERNRITTRQGGTECVQTRRSVNLNLFYTRHSWYTAAIRTREGTGKKRKKKKEKEEKKKGGMGIVGREIAASRHLKQLVKSRMAGLRMSKEKVANSISCSNKNGTPRKCRENGGKRGKCK